MNHGLRGEEWDESWVKRGEEWDESWVKRRRMG